MSERYRECQRDIGSVRVRYRKCQRDIGSVREKKEVPERYRKC